VTAAQDLTMTIRWIVIVTIAEASGFAVATGAALTAILLVPPGWLSLALTVLGGAIEGALLGTGQWLAMGSRRPPASRWIFATTAGAAVAWTLGMLPSTLGIDFAAWWVIVLVALGAVALLASIPVAQWLALRRSGTARWIPVNMASWAIAILWTFAPSPFVDEHSPVALVATLYVIAGILMAITIAALTARTAAKLFSVSGRAG
jgi:hypothetical protein